MNADPARVGFDQATILGHRLSGNSELNIPGASKYWDDHVRLVLRIDPKGSVRSVNVVDGSWEGPEDMRADPTPAIRAARAWRFKPFIWNDAPVDAVGFVDVVYVEPEIAANTKAQFPTVKSSNWSVTLQRGAAFCSAPEYTVTIQGDGTIEYDGVAFNGAGQPPPARFNKYGVLIAGHHVARVEPANLRSLVDQFRAAHFFGLKSEYVYGITDQQTVTLTFKVGDSSWSVDDYVGTAVGMPTVVLELQTAVDQASGAGRWVHGDAGTVEALAAEGTTIDLEMRALLLRLGIERNAPEAFLLDSLTGGEGALDLASSTDSSLLGEALVYHAIVRGMPELLDRLADLGWLVRADRATVIANFVLRSACDAATAKVLAARDSSLMLETDLTGRTALMRAVSLDGPCREDNNNALSFAQTLVALGVPINATANNGETALSVAAAYDVLAFLLASGARADLLSATGLRALQLNFDDRSVLTLLEMGVVPGDASWGRSLRADAEAHYMPATAKWLADHGVGLP